MIISDFTIKDLLLLVAWSVNRTFQVGSEKAKEEGTIDLSHKIQWIIYNSCDHIFIYMEEIPRCIKCNCVPKDFNNDNK